MTHLARRAVALASAAAIFSLPLTSFAQSGSAEAEELFKQGRAALEARDYATACTKLAESNRLERAVGTLISLAQCEEAQDKIASARQHWGEAADLADALQDRLNRGPTARARFKELDKRVPKLVVKRTPTAPATTTAKRDDVTLTAASMGTALPVDPGKHTVTAMAEGFEPKSFEVTLAEGETKELEIEPGPALPAPPPGAGAGAGDAAGAAGGPVNDGSTQRTIGYIVGGAGVVGVALGTVFGLSASSSWSEAKDLCSTTSCPTKDRATAETKKSDAESAGTLSTVAFVIGGAAIATGVVLVLTAPSGKSAPTTGSVRVVPGFGGLSAVGTF